MRELSIEDVDAVSGGNNQVEGIGIVTAGFALLKISGLIGATAIGGIVASPVIAGAALSLALVGGFRFGTPNVTVTEISSTGVEGVAGVAGSDRSDC